VRYRVNPYFVLAIIISGVTAAFSSAVEQGSWSLSFPMPWASPLAVVSEEPTAENAAGMVAVTVLQEQSTGEWLPNCGMHPQRSTKQCSISQQLADTHIQTVAFFARLTGDGRVERLVADRRTSTGVHADPSTVVDASIGSLVAVPSTWCTRRHCGVVASLAPDFIHNDIDSLTAIAAVKAPRAG
jgi:invasion protein IalB